MLRAMIPVLLALAKKKRSWLAVAAVAVLGYYATGHVLTDADRFWTEPRDLLIDRVEAARDTQADAAETIRSAMDEFRAVVGAPDRELEARYEALHAAWERSVTAADKVSQRVDRVVRASNRLLDEWRDELELYNDAELRRLAARQFDSTRENATQLIASMRRSEQRMQPVLDSFRDQVLYLKHNLNLSAIASLDGEAVSIERDVDALIADMNRSIAEADAFISEMLAGSASPAAATQAR